MTLNCTHPTPTPTPIPITYEFTVNIRVSEAIFQGTSTLTLTPNPNMSYSWNLVTNVKKVIVNPPNLSGLNGIGFMSGNNFFSAYKENVLSFDTSSGVLNLFDKNYILQIQGTLTNPAPEPNPNTGMYDTTYNTNYNISNGSGCNKCGNPSCCGGITNIINLNNRND
jgi:hypothetical protein